MPLINLILLIETANMGKIFKITLFITISFYLIQCSPTVPPNEIIKLRFIDSLMNEMTLDEKIGQLTAYTSGWTVTGPTLNENYMEDVLNGRCGVLFNAHTVEYISDLQRMAVEETRLGIPLVFGLDVIHGYKTIFPIPLAEACSWDMKLIEKTASLSAAEAAASGINWNFNPMVDISRDPRWGRIAEGAGEDPWLASLIAKAKVKGIQGDKLDDPLTLAACVKHFAAYGAPLAGRDYNSVDMSLRMLHEIYMPPYKAAVEAGVQTVMTAFNDVNGIPSTGNKYLLNDILRNSWGYNGVVVTDYTSIAELVPHGYAEDLKHAGELAITAGVDVDLQAGVYANFLKESVLENRISVEYISTSVKRVLALKYDLGLFEDPYKYLDSDREKKIIYSDEIMEHALLSAIKSIVLLKNDEYEGKKLLPLARDIQRIAIIGPLGDNKIDVLGTWHGSGEATRTMSLLEGMKKEFPHVEIKYARGCDFKTDDKSGFSHAIQIARESDIIILAIGENFQQSGEAASRSNIDLPGIQNELIRAIVKTGIPTIAIVMAGRPLTINWLSENVPAIMYAWHLGTRTGDAIAALLSGKENPSGKLVVTFPQNVGQIPVAYNMFNTGRPYDPDNKYTTQYIDVSNDPLYPFGYGLSYTSYKYSDITLNKSRISYTDTLHISVTVENIGKLKGEEIVQLYIRDIVGSVVRPLKELKGFKKVSISPSNIVMVDFQITVEDLKFFDNELNHIIEPGMFKVFVGTNSRDVQEAEFEYVK